MHDMASDYSRRVGVMLTAAMAARKMSQAELARVSGVEASRISRYETGETEQTAQVMVRLAEVLEFPVELLLVNPLDSYPDALVKFGALAAALQDEPEP